MRISTALLPVEEKVKDNNIKMKDKGGRRREREREYIDKYRKMA